MYPVAKTLQMALWPDWLTGPIFSKELRVSSRRRRSYALRVFYILLLTVFVGIVWLSVVEYQGNATFQQSRMAAAGKRIVYTVVIFQFIAAQALAIVMLSTAISDEVYHRTLGLLMTTPINSLQIVMGKVLSRLLQLILLLAISLPILAIVRVLGGVSWDYLLASLCVTLAAAILAGSLSLLFSIENRHAYGVITRAMFAVAGLYFILPAVVVGAWQLILPAVGVRISPQSTIVAMGAVVVLHLNPFFGLGQMTARMLTPAAAVVPYSWPLQCGVLLGLSALVLGRGVAVVRRVALRQATGQLEVLSAGRRKQRRMTSAEPAQAETPARGNVKRVHGPAVVWKELRAPFIQGVDNRNSYIGFGVTVIALLLTYLTTAWQKCLDENFTHVSYALLFVFTAVLVNVVFAATRITTEKESQSLLLLLTTPLSDWTILLGKGVSAFRRCLPIWGLLAGHVVLFTLVGFIHPAAIPHLLILVIWLTCFITGAGLYFGTRFNRTTTAVVASFMLIVALWVLGPIVAGLLSVADKQGDLFARYMWVHPAVQTEMIMASASGRTNAQASWRSLDYGTEHVVFDSGGQALSFGRMTCTLGVIAAAYTLAGLLFLARARRHLRHKVFQ